MTGRRVRERHRVASTWPHDSVERIRVRVDAVTLVSAFLLALWLIPQQWVLPGGGAIARPAILLGLVIAVLYAGSRLLPALVPSGRNPVAFGLWGYGLIVLVSFGLSSNRDLLPEEVTGGQREVILTIAMVGVGLMVSGSISDRDRLETLLKRLVGLAGVVAFLALLQFYAGLDIPARMRVPGLVLNSGSLARSQIRSGFTRATGTTAHAIELGVVMAMMLPLALHYAFHEPNRRLRFWYWIATVLIAWTLPTTVSRSSMVASAVSIGVLASIWSSRLFWRTAAVGAIGVAAVRVSSPTLLGSVLSLFRGLSSDTSITARTSDYSTAFAFVSQRPLFGRGAGTWGSDTYLLLDNQMLLSLLEIGWIGIASISMLYLSGAATARSIRLSAPDDATRHLGQALTGSILAGYVALFFVNGFFYEIYFGTTVVLIGAAGALRRLMIDRPLNSDVVARTHGHGFLAPRLRVDGKPRWWQLALGNSKSSSEPSE